MTQKQFTRWLLAQPLTSVQVRMAAILYAMNGLENARQFVEHVTKSGDELDKAAIQDDWQTVGDDMRKVLG